MAYVEEITPEDDLQSFPEHTLFTVLDNWNPPSDFGSDNNPPPASMSLGPRSTSLEDHYTTCYIEEEIPPEPPREAALQAHNQQVHTHHDATETIPLVSIDSHR
jgi:hypothetical protein